MSRDLTLDQLNFIQTQVTIGTIDMNYLSTLVHDLIDVIKDQHTQITELEKRIEQLERFAPPKRLRNSI